MKIGRSLEGWPAGRSSLLCALCDSGIPSSVLFSPLCWLSPPLGRVLNISIPHFFPSSWEWLSCLLEAELMWLLCTERSFLFWSLFTSAWKHFLCLLSVCLYISDHRQPRPRLTCGTCDLLHGEDILGRMMWGGGAEICVLVSLWQSPRPVWGLWRTVAESNANTFISGGDFWISNVCCLFQECTGGYSLSTGSLIGCMWRAWSLGYTLSDGKGSSWPGAIEYRAEEGRRI